MKTKIIVWFAILCIGIMACAQVPVLTGPAGVYSSSVTLTAPGPINLPSPWNGPPGEYKFTATVPVTVTKTDTSYTISWVAPSPPPPPVPPTPVPITTQLYTFVLFDKSATTPPTVDQLAIQKSTTIVKSLSDLKSSWTVGDVSSPAFAVWLPDAQKAGIPALLVLSLNANGNGVLVEAIPLPDKDTENAIIAEVKKLRGK